MSLKTFHFVFIAAALAFCAGFGVWAIRNGLAPHGGGPFRVVLGALSIGCAGAGLVYSRWFFVKLKKAGLL